MKSLSLYQLVERSGKEGFEPRLPPRASFYTRLVLLLLSILACPLLGFPQGFLGEVKPNSPSPSLGLLLCLASCLLSPISIDMSLFEGESHPMSHVSRLRSSGECSLDRACYSNHEKDNIHFKVVRRTHQPAGPSGSIPPPARVAIALVHGDLAGITSTMTREGILHL